MSKIIFVNSPARSGSTVLDMILGNDPNGFSLGEVVNHYWPWRKQYFNSRCACGYKNCDVRKEIISHNKKDLYPFLLDEKKYDFVVDSSKNPMWLLDGVKIANQRGYEVHNVLVYKDPLDLAYSYFKRQQSTDDLGQSYDYFQNFIELDLPFVSISLSNFLNDVPANLENLCNHLGIPYFEGKEEFWNKEQHHFFGSQSVRHMKYAEKKGFRKKEPFSEEFKQLIPELTDQVNQDKKLHSIISTLREHDISLNPSIAPNPTTNLTYNYPWRYHMLKLYRLTVQRVFLDKHTFEEFPIFD